MYISPGVGLSKKKFRPLLHQQARRGKGKGEGNALSCVDSLLPIRLDQFAWMERSDRALSSNDQEFLFHARRPRAR